ncbi:MAG: hypothetical protein HA494_07735 [Thaumarchaeota archaeon]|nr:hypothetical protein [Nitrososphaerota archaeon]
MPDVKNLLKILRVIKQHQPIHIYGLANYLGKPTYASTTAWRWIHYLEELGLLVKKGGKRKRGRIHYALSKKGEKLLTALEEVWGRETLYNVSEIYKRRRAKTRSYSRNKKRGG